MEQAEYTVTRDDTKALTQYRLRLPLFALGLDSKPGTLFGLSVVLFHDDNGKGYDFWMQTSPGVAGGWNPLLFDRFVLE